MKKCLNRNFKNIQVILKKIKCLRENVRTELWLFNSNIYLQGLSSF